MSDAILRVEHLMMRFGGIKALNEVNLEVERGSITALIGPNGAGKTTVFNCLTGFYRASGGAILLNTHKRPTDVIRCWGRNFAPATGYARSGSARVSITRCSAAPTGQPRRLARTFQNIRLFREMSVVENLLVAQHMQSNRNLIAGVLNTPGYRRAESAALDHAFYWLEVVDLVDCANRLAGRCPTASSGGWRSRAPCAPRRR